MADNGEVRADAVEPALWGKYRVLGILGRGGMAEVFLACKSGAAGFSKLVALKRIVRAEAANPYFLEMFLDEARLTANMNHPNVVATFDLEQIDGTYVLVSEYVDGVSLASMMRALSRRGQRLSLDAALHIVCSAASGLHYAHECRGSDGTSLGIVHRDVSPDNILVSRDGAVKLTDFGIARASTRQTRTLRGVRKGKVDYMSPEQLCDEPFDRRSDVYSLGLVLYELTTGLRVAWCPATNRSGHPVCDIVPPSTRRSGYPSDLESIVRRACHVEPSQRLPDAESLHHELDVFARRRGLSLSPLTVAGELADLFRSNDVSSTAEA